MPNRRKNRDAILHDAVTNPYLLLWGIAYVILKWTVGLWTFRRLRAWARHVHSIAITSRSASAWAITSPTADSE